MEVLITGMSPENLTTTRVYFTIDGGELQSLLMSHSDLANTNTVENAIKDLLKGKQYIGHSFTIES